MTHMANVLKQQCLQDHCVSVANSVIGFGYVAKATLYRYYQLLICTFLYNIHVCYA